MWYDTEQTTYTYISDTLLTEMLIQDIANNNFTNNYRETCTYNQDNLIEEFNVQFWEIDHWRNYSRILYTYDNNKRPETKTELFWFIENWEVRNKEVKVYDNNNHTSEIRNYSYENGNWHDQDIAIDFPVRCNDIYTINYIFNGYKIEFYYNGGTVYLSDALKTSQTTLIYPNPATSEINVKKAPQLNEKAWLELFDINGKLYLRQKLSESTTNPHLPSGTYIYGSSEKSVPKIQKRINFETKNVNKFTIPRLWTE